MQINKVRNIEIRNFKKINSIKKQKNKTLPLLITTKMTSSDLSRKAPCIRQKIKLRI